VGTSVFTPLMGVVYGRISHKKAYPDFFAHLSKDVTKAVFFFTGHAKKDDGFAIVLCVAY